MIYLDSTYIVKCYVQERGTSEVLRLVQGHPGRASCGHGRIEFWTGIHRQVREGHLARADAEKVYRQFRLDEDAGLWVFFPVTADLVRQCCATIDGLPDNVFIRSADALHLTCAREQGFAEIYSNDRHLLAAAPHFGVAGKNVIP